MQLKISSIQFSYGYGSTSNDIKSVSAQVRISSDDLRHPVTVSVDIDEPAYQSIVSVVRDAVLRDMFGLSKTLDHHVSDVSVEGSTEVTPMAAMDDYARLTLQRELIDVLWMAQAEKVGMRADAPRWLVRIAVGIHEMVPEVADILTKAGDALSGFGEALVYGIASGLRTRPALPLNHGQRYHTNRTRTR